MSHERVFLHRLLIGLTLIVLIAVSAGVGLLVANWPDCLRYLSTGR